MLGSGAEQQMSCAYGHAPMPRYACADPFDVVHDLSAMAPLEPLAHGHGAISGRHLAMASCPEPVPPGIHAFHPTAGAAPGPHMVQPHMEPAHHYSQHWVQPGTMRMPPQQQPMLQMGPPGHLQHLEHLDHLDHLAAAISLPPELMQEQQQPGRPCCNSYLHQPQPMPHMEPEPHHQFAAPPEPMQQLQQHLLLQQQQYQHHSPSSSSNLKDTPTVKPSTQMLQMLRFPKPEQAACGDGDEEDFVVKLTLTVSTGTGSVAPGLSIEDCGRCIFCLDKPKNGGRGTKRQKCTLKRMPIEGPARVWSSLRVVSERYQQQLEEYASQAPPQELVDANKEAPLKLVWGFRRARRARPLPPAYVLMYHCERHVNLDRSFLTFSLEQRRLGNRGVSRTVLSSYEDDDEPYPPRRQPGGPDEEWSSDGTELQDELNDGRRGLEMRISQPQQAAHPHAHVAHVQHPLQQQAKHVEDVAYTYMNSSEDEADPNKRLLGGSSMGGSSMGGSSWPNRGMHLAQDPSWQELNRMLGLHDSDPGGFASQGYIFMPGLVPVPIVGELNIAADRRGSRARRNSKTISGSALQMDAELFTTAEQRHVQRLVNGLLSSNVVQAAASIMWSDGCQQVPLRLVSCSILEGGTQQMPHADALYASALVVLVTLRAKQTPTLVHRDMQTGRTAFSWVQPPPNGASEEVVQQQMSAALDAIDVVSQPDALQMVPAVDDLLDMGDALLFTSTLVHAGPGGFAQDGKSRRIAFVTFEPQESNSSEGYDPSLQYNAALYWFRRCLGNQDYFFEQLYCTRERWLELGHDPTTFLTEEGADRYRDWEASLMAQEHDPYRMHSCLSRRYH